MNCTSFGMQCSKLKCSIPFLWTGQIAESNCTWCSPGKYQTGVGVTAEASCSWCGAGKYQTGSGSSWHHSSLLQQNKYWPNYYTQCISRRSIVKAHSLTIPVLKLDIAVHAWDRPGLWGWLHVVWCWKISDWIWWDRLHMVHCWKVPDRDRSDACIHTPISSNIRPGTAFHPATKLLSDWGILHNLNLAC